MMRLDNQRVRAIIRKELREYRRKRAIVVTMAILPIAFLVQPTLAVFLAPVTADDTYYRLPLLLLLLISVMMPSTLSAYSVVGEREQGTLEPLLTTPIRREEFIAGKAAAVMIPSVAVSYAVFALFLAAVRLFAKPAISTAVFQQRPALLALVLFTPLLAGWAIVVGMAISVRANEIRVAQQLGTLASLPPLGVVVLFAVGIIHPTFTVAILFAVGLLAIDVRALRIVAKMFDRERLVTGTRAT
jgi:ABC-type transport system involved in multi-copper enzyme maturation permease subunit